MNCCIFISFYFINNLRPEQNGWQLSNNIFKSYVISRMKIVVFYLQTSLCIFTWILTENKSAMVSCWMGNKSSLPDSMMTQLKDIKYQCHHGHDANFLIADGIPGHQKDYLQCHQWPRSWHHDNSQFSVDICKHGQDSICRTIYVSVNSPSLVQIIFCRLVSAKPLSEPMLGYC